MDCGPSEALHEKRYVTIVLRLLLDKHGALVHGTVADAAGRPGRRFDGWEGLVPAIQDALAGGDA